MGIVNHYMVVVYESTISHVLSVQKERQQHMLRMCKTDKMLILSVCQITTDSLDDVYCFCRRILLRNWLK